MSPNPSKSRCKKAELIPLLAIVALPADELRDTEAHIASCAQCRQELETLGRVTDSFVAWPTDVLRPDPSLWRRLAERISAETGIPPELPARGARLEPEWEEVAPGISCKLLATDTERGRVSMLVRLAPGVGYPAHMHAEFEELHLLAGELWIDDRKLHAGDFYRAEPGTADRQVWSETGCTCFLTTSFRDLLA
jgi:anti-sigma factor RsiW